MMPAYPHRIRLRGPWSCQPLYRLLQSGNQKWTRTVDGLPATFRFAVPGAWDSTILSDFRGAARFVRPFGYPGRIDANERVWLTIGEIRGQASVLLNETTLGKIEAAGGEFEITALLRQRNVLQLEIASQEPMDGLWSEVALEVRAPAFLRGVQFDRQGSQLTARGLVVGEAPEPLELYLIGGRQCVAYDRVSPSQGGTPFILAGEAPLEIPLRVKVELIDTATVFYVMEGSLDDLQSNSDRATS